MMKPRDIFMYVLGAFVVSCNVIIICIMLFIELPEKNHDIINTAVGSMMMNSGLVVGYFFGSSKSSADKTVLMNDKINRGERIE